MHISIIKEADGYTMVVDGVVIEPLQLPLESDISAIQWHGESGEIEYCDCQNHPNEPVTSFAVIQKCLDVWNATKAELDAEEEEARIAWENSWERVRLERESLFRASDWAVLPDSPLSSEQQDEARAYRQQLRDVTTSFAEAKDVVWPEPPEFLA